MSQIQYKETSIAANGLTKKFGKFTAVDDISFSVNPGEIFGFLGPNGSFSRPPRAYRAAEPGI